MVGAPFALITASIRRGMEVISLWHCWGGVKPRFLWQWPSAHLHFLVYCFSFSSWQYVFVFWCVPANFCCVCCFFYITDNHLTLNWMKSGSQSAQSHILRDTMTAKESPKTLQAESEELYYKYVYTHKEFVLMTGASSAEESTDIVQTYIWITQKEWNITQI